MKKIFLLISIPFVITTALFAQKNSLSLQGGVAFAISEDLSEISKTLGYSYGFDYKRDLFELGGATFGLITDLKMTNFLLNSGYLTDGIYLQNNNLSGNKSYQELSMGLGMCVGHEIGRSGFFYEVDVELLGIYDMEPNFDFYTYVWEGELAYKIDGSLDANNTFTIGYNLGAKFYKMINNNFGIGLQVDWLECAPNVTTHITTKNPYVIDESTDKCNYKYLTTQLKVVRKF